MTPISDRTLADELAEALAGLFIADTFTEWAKARAALDRYHYARETEGG